MFKIILSTAVLVAVISVSTSVPLLGPQGTELLANIYTDVFAPPSALIGALSGGLVEGSDGASKGGPGGAAVAEKLGQSIKDSGNGGTAQELGATLGALTGIFTSGPAGILSTLGNGSIEQGIKDSNAVADQNIKLGQGISNILG